MRSGPGLFEAGGGPRFEQGKLGRRRRRKAAADHHRLVTQPVEEDDQQPTHVGIGFAEEDVRHTADA
jgi:hypothetical protein